MTTVKPEQFQIVAKKILEEYNTEVREATAMTVEEVADEAQDKLKTAGTFDGTKYRRSWSVELRQKALYTEATVYNKKHYRLTHLLEFGHQLKRGGRTIGHVKAFEHIAPVNNAVEKAFQSKLAKALGG